MYVYWVGKYMYVYITGNGLLKKGPGALVIINTIFIIHSSVWLVRLYCIYVCIHSYTRVCTLYTV